jgi:hypothetical protein
MRVPGILTFGLLLAVSSAVWAADATTLGKPLTLKKQTAISAIAHNRDKYVNRLVQVKGKVTEACEHSGCYMMLANDQGNTVKIKRATDDIVFPTSAIGKMARAEGKFVKVEMTQQEAQERAKAEAAERNVPVEKMKVETVIWQIESTAAEILN